MRDRVYEVKCKLARARLTCSRLLVCFHPSTTNSSIPGTISPSKWRTAEVLELVGGKLRVHYLGWGHEFDEVLDLAQDMHRLRRVCVCRMSYRVSSR